MMFGSALGITSTTSSTAGNSWFSAISSATNTRQTALAVQQLAAQSSFHNFVVAEGGGFLTSAALPVRITDDFIGEITLPDGAVMKFDGGKYHIEEAGAQISYRANRRREFNRYVNASDLLEEFIGDMASLGINQKQFLALPINAFITWLVLKASQADDEAAYWRCNACGRFTRQGLIACGPPHVMKMLGGSR